jgi:hypothetical protein
VNASLKLEHWPTSRLIPYAGYCDVIIKRWEEFTGKKAVLEGGQDGRS